MPGQRARVDAVLLRAVHPHPGELEVGSSGDRPDRQLPDPTGRPSHHSVRHVLPGSAGSAVIRRAARAGGPGPRRRSSCVGSRWRPRSASGGGAPPPRRRTTPGSGPPNHPGAVSASGPSSVAPTRPMRCSSSVTHTLLIAPSANGATPASCSATHTLDVADGREPARRPGRRARRARSGRVVPAHWSSSASSVRRRPARATPRRCARRAARR